jgi:hypothetical protein
MIEYKGDYTLNRNKFSTWEICIFFCVTFAHLGCAGGGSNGNNNDNNPMPSVDLQAGEPVNNIEEFEIRLENIRNALYIPGMSAAITNGGQVVWAKGFGYADKENHVLMEPITSSHLASLTKPFAAVIIMRLVEAGMLDLQEPISILKPIETLIGRHISESNIDGLRHGRLPSSIPNLGNSRVLSKFCSFDRLALTEEYWQHCSGPYTPI